MIIFSTGTVLCFLPQPASDLCWLQKIWLTACNMFFFAILLILLRAKTGENGIIRAKTKRNTNSWNIIVFHLWSTSCVYIYIHRERERDTYYAYQWLYDKNNDRMYSNRLDMIGFFHGVGQWVIWCNMVSKYPASLLDWILKCTTLAGGFAGKWCWNHRFLQVRSPSLKKRSYRSNSTSHGACGGFLPAAATEIAGDTQGDYSTTGKDLTNDNVSKAVNKKTPIFW